MRIKLISPTLHGVIDWLTAATLPILPRVYGWDRKVTRLHDILAGGIAATAAVTDFPPGLVKLMPLETHLMLDKMHGAMCLTAAAVMDDEPCAARCCIAATGAFLLLQAFCTRTAGREHSSRKALTGDRAAVGHYAHQTRPDIYGGAAERPTPAAIPAS